MPSSLGESPGWSRSTAPKRRSRSSSRWRTSSWVSSRRFLSARFSPSRWRRRSSHPMGGLVPGFSTEEAHKDTRSLQKNGQRWLPRAMKMQRQISLFNTLTRKIEPVVPVVPGTVSLYTCGPTVYNYAHIGNLRTFLFQDLLKRTFKAAGHEVRHCMNITDVEDKIIRDSQIALPADTSNEARHSAMKALTDRFTAVFLRGSGDTGHPAGGLPPPGHGVHPADDPVGPGSRSQGPGVRP